MAHQNAQPEPRNKVIAYVLWFFLGQLGVHRFYCGKNGTAVIQLLLALIGYATTVILIGYIILPILWLWLIVDIFLIPGMCNHPN
ncbi:TM2 domain-containing protein [Staphylococcus auricularis]|uniref:TM2 domain-containing protein n=1 Tax=Staphylococcus auricularis TaxID=29379 RepID=A0ABX5IFK5_9STAP|nr:TM2 domain-containing protein [Staphylococcus auricularis]MCE5039371.1 TM2 domain-containing protein [Staphylococcus auricularis]MEB6570442.1 TM2 domain-containing protein [Staphylococcus auricularis]PTH18183.1 TM2 domain-containing protein [Staphylococcus auricularis]PTH27262.1 TM2 domain-containing protein [Staphylococcus auricularis]